MSAIQRDTALLDSAQTLTQELQRLLDSLPGGSGDSSSGGTTGVPPTPTPPTPVVDTPQPSPLPGPPMVTPSWSTFEKVATGVGFAASILFLALNWKKTS